MLLGGGGGVWSGVGGGQLDMRISNFVATILGEAVSKAVTEMATNLEQQAGKLPTNVVHYAALVADVSGNTLIINVGTKAGVQVGDRIHITRVARVIKDPATGKVLKKVEDTLGDMTVTQVDADSATGTYAGAGAPKVGDTAEGSH